MVHIYGSFTSGNGSLPGEGPIVSRDRFFCLRETVHSPHGSLLTGEGSFVFGVPPHPCKIVNGTVENREKLARGASWLAQPPAFF